jgi:hypothetical protein
MGSAKDFEVIERMEGEETVFSLKPVGEVRNAIEICSRRGDCRRCGVCRDVFVEAEGGNSPTINPMDLGGSEYDG